MKEVTELFDDPKPWVKFLVGSAERNQVRGRWRRHLSSVSSERSRPSNVRMQEMLRVHMPHTLLFSTKSTFYRTTCQLSTFELFLILIHRALQSLASLCIFAQSNHFIARDLQCEPRKWQHFSCRKRISLSILEEDCKAAFNSHSVFLMWDFF